MSERFVIAIARDWIRQAENGKRLTQNLLALGTDPGSLTSDCSVLLKWRTDEGRIVLDASARILKLKDSFYLRSDNPSFGSQIATVLGRSESLLIFAEGTHRSARCVLVAVAHEFFEEARTTRPHLRLDAHDLPPLTVTLADTAEIVEGLFAISTAMDPELMGVVAHRFLDSPPILVPLFEHVMRLSSSDHLEFPIQLKSLADVLRHLLLDVASTVKIHSVPPDHIDAWAAVQGSRIAFLDGGVARIAGLPNTDPLALRIGVYCVRPGLQEPAERESWNLWPFVVGDITEPAPVARHSDEYPDRRRLMEGIRYVCEAAGALRSLRERPDTYALFLHGPLINQFVMYDEGEPHFLPCLNREFLEAYELSEATVRGLVTQIPSAGGTSLWNQFMAVYGALALQLWEAPQPLLGVVERTAGRWLADAVLQALVDDGAINEKLKKKMEGILTRFAISDDFLFGCVLREGEYLTPLPIKKNPPHRAREPWQDVVRQYPRPMATILKTAEGNFPYRIELNRAASNAPLVPDLMRLLYHTSRLLPRYAFPVGLDIVDKFAKIPDWLSRGVSARISADVLRSALRTGDPVIVSQVRRFLARSPRDFFYRPTV